MSAVSLKGVSKQFKAGVTALDGIDLDVEPGEFVSLIGPSGDDRLTPNPRFHGLLVGVTVYPNLNESFRLPRRFTHAGPPPSSSTSVAASPTSPSRRAWLRDV